MKGKMFSNICFARNKNKLIFHKFKFCFIHTKYSNWPHTKVLHEEIVTDSKQFKQQKCQNLKRNLDHLSIVQKDLQSCVMEFQKAKAEPEYCIIPLESWLCSYTN